MEGLSLPVGSVQEAFAINAFRDKQKTRYIETLFIVNSIITASNRIVAAITGDQSSSSGDLKEIQSIYKELLMPEFREEKEQKTKEVQAIMEREASAGAFKVTPMVFERRKKKGFN